MRLTRMAATTALVLTAGLGLAACSDDDTAPSPETTSDSPQESSDDSSDALSQEEFLQRVPAAMLEAGTVHAVLEGGGAGSGEGDISFGEDPGSTMVAMTVGDVEVRVLDGVYYLNLGQTSGGQFVKVDPTAGGPFAAFSGLLDQTNPTTQFQTVTDALVGFEPSDETEEIDGQETRAYVLTVDPAKVLTPDQQQLAGGELPATIEVTMHVGGDDLPRRVVTEVGGQAVTIEYSQWGDEVDIQAPPADQVVEGGAFGL